MSSVKKCPKCGYENPVNAKYCLNCGYKFPEARAEEGNIPVYILISTLLSIVYLIDIFSNEVYKSLFRSLLTLGFLTGFIGALMIIFIFIKRESIQSIHIKIFIVGNILAGLGGFIIYIIPVMTGHVITSLYWIIYLVIAYIVYREVKEGLWRGR